MRFSCEQPIAYTETFLRTWSISVSFLKISFPSQKGELASCADNQRRAEDRGLDGRHGGRSGPDGGPRPRTCGRMPCPCVPSSLRQSSSSGRVWRTPTTPRIRPRRNDRSDGCDAGKRLHPSPRRRGRRHLLPIPRLSPRLIPRPSTRLASPPQQTRRSTGPWGKHGRFDRDPRRGSGPLALPAASIPNSPAEISSGGQSMTMEAARNGALTTNPDLVTLRQGNPLAASPEAVEVARRFPTTLNPTLWIDYRPITLIPQNTFGSGSPAGNRGGGNSGFYHHGQNYFYISYRQPFELANQTAHWHEIAKGCPPPAAMDRHSGRIDRAGADLSAVPGGRLSSREAPRGRAARRLRRPAGRDAQEAARGQSGAGRRRDPGPLGEPGRAAAGPRLRGRSTWPRSRTSAIRSASPIPVSASEPLGEFTLPAYVPPVDEQEDGPTGDRRPPRNHGGTGAGTGGRARW